jgi:hypothetical protein
MEYGGNVRVKSAPNPFTSVVMGTIFAGSVIELVSAGLAAAIVVALPLASTVVSPLIARLQLNLAFSIVYECGGNV